jgi:hypothetical protein
LMDGWDTNIQLYQYCGIGHKTRMFSIGLIKK